MFPTTTTGTTTKTLGRTDSFYPHINCSTKCLYESTTMRFSKKQQPFASFCLSFLSSKNSPFPSTNTILLQFLSISSSNYYHTPLKRRRGVCQWKAGYTMEGAQTQMQQNQNQGCIWSSPGWGCKIDLGRHIFCNRSLNMKNIVAVGFDMDYTLAQYMPETFETLAYNGTIRKLVYDLGYPPELLEWTFDWRYMVRGLVVDKKRGNILKMDRHKYVKVAYHGFTEMSKEDKMATYGNTLIRDSFDEPDYALIDTLFSLAEAYLFAQLVDFKDKNPNKVPDGADYFRMYKDVRAAVDLCHRDGTLKQMVEKDPGK